MDADDKNTQPAPGVTRHLKPSQKGRLMPKRETSPLDSQLPWVMEFRVIGTASTLQMQVRGSMVIGREDPEQNVYPEIDLTPFEAYRKGVSREHAVVVVRDDGLFIKDLGSTNGTRLNDFELLAGEQYRLRHGDEISIGQLRIQVGLTVVPAQLGDAPMLPDDVPVVGSGQHVLVIEDDKEVGAVFTMALEQAGFSVTLANTAESGLGYITHQAPNVIILDLYLPDMNGLELLRYVRRQPQTKATPLLVVSSATGGYQKKEALEAGANNFLGKPINISELIQAVNDVLIKDSNISS